MRKGFLHPSHGLSQRPEIEVGLNQPEIQLNRLFEARLRPPKIAFLETAHPELIMGRSELRPKCQCPNDVRPRILPVALLYERFIARSVRFKGIGIVHRVLFHWFCVRFHILPNIPRSGTMKP
jgi:hypothetical protein